MATLGIAILVFVLLAAVLIVVSGYYLTRLTLSLVGKGRAGQEILGVSLSLKMWVELFLGITLAAALAGENLPMAARRSLSLALLVLLCVQAMCATVIYRRWGPRWEETAAQRAAQRHEGGMPNEGPTDESLSATARHDELMTELRHQTVVGEAGLHVGEEGLVAAEDAKEAATEATEEAAEAKSEATQAHQKSQEGINLLIEAARQDGLTPAQLPPGVALVVAPTGTEPLRVTVVPDPENPVPVDVVDKPKKDEGER